MADRWELEVEELFDAGDDSGDASPDEALEAAGLRQ